MKNLMILLITFMYANTIYGQATYLKITQTNNANDYVMYPPGTKFELKTKEGYLIFKNSDDPGVIDITEKHTLYVYPTWKNTTDVFVLTEGKVEKLLSARYKETTHTNNAMESNGVTANYSVTDSEELVGKKNLEFKLSNGITFLYEDDKYRAYLNDQHNYIRIKGKYLIETELGTLKISFNPNNGVVWWIFEKV